MALQQARTCCASRSRASERPLRACIRLLDATISGSARHFTRAASDRRPAIVGVLVAGRSPRARTSVSVHICGHKGMRIEQAVDNFNTHRSLLRLAHELSQQTSKTEQTASVIPHSDQLSRKGRCQGPLESHSAPKLQLRLECPRRSNTKRSTRISRV